VDLAALIRSVKFRLSPAQSTLLLLIALNLLNFIDRYILPGEVPLIQAEFHCTDQQMGALTTALFAVYMLVAPITGWLADLFPRKPLIIFGATAWSLATLATVWVHDYTTLYIRHALVGVGEATFTFLAPTVLADFYPPRERNKILSIFYLGIPIGAALGYLAGGQLGTLWGWRAPFLICGAPGIAVAMLYWMWGTEPQRGACDAFLPEPTPRPSNLDEYLHAARKLANRFVRLFTNPAYLTATLGLAMQTFAMGGISAWVPTFLARVTGMPLGNASWAVSVITVVDGIGGTLIGGWIAQRWLRRNHRALYLLSFWGVALTIPCGLVLFFGPHRWAVPALLAAEFFIMLNNGPLNAAVVNSVSAQVRAMAIGLNLFFIHFLGDTFSPQIIGAISDRSNLGIGLGATLISLFVSSGLLLYGARFAPLLEPESAVR
jgi:MFS family permease